jgi:hypothetical protein
MIMIARMMPAVMKLRPVPTGSPKMLFSPGTGAKTSWIHCDDLAVVVAVEPDPVGPWPCARGVDLSARAAAPQGTTNQADVTS